MLFLVVAVFLGRPGWAQERKVGLPGFPGRTISLFHMQEPSPEYHPLPQRKESLAMGLKPESMRPICCMSGGMAMGTLWLLGYVAKRTELLSFFMHDSKSHKHLPCAGSGVRLA